MFGTGLHLGLCLVEQIVTLPISQRPLRKETISKVHWHTRTLLVRGRAVRGAQFGWTRLTAPPRPAFYLVASLHKGLPARTEVFLGRPGVWHGIRWLLVGKSPGASSGTRQAVLMQQKHRGKNHQRGRPSWEAPCLPSPRPKTPGAAEPGSSYWCAHLRPSWHPIPQGGCGFPSQNITKEQLPLVMEEYLGDIDDHDWKMLQSRLEDLAGGTTFGHSTL